MCISNMPNSWYASNACECSSYQQYFIANAICLGTSESDSNTLGTETRPAGEAWQPPSSPGLAHYLEEAKRRARELKEKTGQWSRRLTLVHTLTMHTAMARKDNDTPAAVTSLCISRQVSRCLSTSTKFKSVIGEDHKHG